MVSENICKALQEYFDKQGLTQVAIAEKLGVSKAYVNSLFTGKRPFGKKQAEIWEATFGISRAFLLSGEGEMLKGDSSNVRALGRVYTVHEGDEGVAVVDYIPATATATFVEYMGDNNPELDKIAIMKQPGEVLDDSYKVFEVIGESMSPAIPNRAKILTRCIAQSKWEQAEGVVVVVFGDEVVVKRIINNDIAVNNCLVLSSDNPKFGERRIALADIRAIFKALRIVSADIL